jgi:hypothetical protein
MNNSAGDKHVTVGTDHDRLRLASHRSAKQDQCQGLCNQQIDVSAVDNRDIEATRCLYPINAGEYRIMLCERDFTAITGEHCANELRVDPRPGRGD